jgi:hypothetical protein
VTPTKHKASNRPATNKAVHRPLILVSPVLKGPDVRELQESLNGLASHYKFPWRQIREDGEFGKRTFRHARFVAWLIGLDVEHAIPHFGVLNEQVQQLLRNPDKRSSSDRHREDERKPEREARRKKHAEGGPVLATKWMLDHVGVNEQPAESNHGPFPIDACQEHFGLSGVPWCGCCAGYACVVIGKADCPTWWPYAGSIRGDAESGHNNLEDVNPANADIDCVATFFTSETGNDHVAKIRGKSRDGLLLTVEGNTSSATRDADGGIIETKERPFSEASCVARLTAW